MTATEEEKIANNQEYLDTIDKKCLYNGCSNLSLPLSSTKLFRFIHLRNFAQILESLDQALNRKHPIEICFHLRNYLEHSANFSYALEEIISAAKQLLNNIKLETIPSTFDPEIRFYNCSNEYEDSSNKLYQLLTYSYFQTNVNISKYGLDLDKIVGNESIVPDKSYSFKSVNITKKLKAFESKVDFFHPTYDLLSEFLHPNSFTLYSSFVSSGKQKSNIQKSNINIKDQKLEEGLCAIEYFFGEKNRLFIEAITLETLKGDSELLSLQGKIFTKLKAANIKMLSSYDYKSDSTYVKTPCVCGSKKKLIFCCAK